MQIDTLHLQNLSWGGKTSVWFYTKTANWRSPIEILEDANFTFWGGCKLSWRCFNYRKGAKPKKEGTLGFREIRGVLRWRAVPPTFLFSSLFRVRTPTGNCNITEWQSWGSDCVVLLARGLFMVVSVVSVFGVTKFLHPRKQEEKIQEFVSISNPQRASKSILQIFLGKKAFTQFGVWGFLLRLTRRHYPIALRGWA